MDRCTYICIPCRFTSKYAGSCPQCSSPMIGMYDYAPPKKRDDNGWRIAELAVKVSESDIWMCDGWCCAGWSWRPGKRNRPGKQKDGLTLNQYRGWIHKRLTHRLVETPKYSRTIK